MKDGHEVTKCLDNKQTIQIKEKLSKDNKEYPKNYNGVSFDKKRQIASINSWAQNTIQMILSEPETSQEIKQANNNHTDLLSEVKLLNRSSVCIDETTATTYKLVSEIHYMLLHLIKDLKPELVDSAGSLIGYNRYKRELR